MGAVEARPRVILLWLAACDRTPDALPPQLPIAADKATFGTMKELGSWKMTAEVRRRTGDSAPSVELFEVKWRDADHWSWLRTRDGAPLSEVVVWRAIAWTRNGRGDLERKGDAESWRVELANVWDPWDWGLEGLAQGVVLTPGPVELLDGRRAVHYTVSSAPPNNRRGWQVSRAQGDVWIDEATAVRLKGALTVEAGAGGQTRSVELLFSVDGIGLDPDISAPRRDTR